MWEAKDQEDFYTGPLGILTRAVKNNSLVLINCRDNKILLGRVRAFDQGCNMDLEEVREMWVRLPKAETKGETIAPLYKDRIIPRLLLGGESIISILKIKEQTLSLDDSKIATTLKKPKSDETYMSPERDTDTMT